MALILPSVGPPWGREATQALRALVMAKHVELEPFAQDRYDRLVANGFVGSVNVNDTLVSEGHGWAYRQYLTQDNLDLCGLEVVARRDKRGLWALKPEQRAAPWDWRKRPKQFVDYSQATEQTCVTQTSIPLRGARQGTD